MDSAFHFIDGRRVPSRSGATFETENPATGELLADVAFAGREDVDDAVCSAARAFDDGSWRGLAPSERARRLRRVARLVEDHGDSIAELESRDCGKPITGAEGDIAAAVELLEFYSTLPESVHGVVYADQAGFHTHSRREPYGVVGAIASWNYPFLNAVFRTGAALAFGNSVVLKMAEQAPLTTSRFAELCFEAGIPAGALNVVHGDGPTTGAALVAHPMVPKITFAGSPEVGREILRASAEHVKSCQLELGGKSPNIVFDDSDIDAAVSGVLFSGMANSGQVCSAGSRLIISEAVAAEFERRLVASIESLVVGDPMDRQTQLGPLVSAEQRAGVESYIAAGREAGAVVAVGGGRPPSPELSRGYYVEPTLFTEVLPDMRIAREEIFGPVISMLTFSSDEEALALANDSSYGLAACVWTSSLDRALAMTDRLEAGIVWTNCPQHEVWHASYVGRKGSGLGEDLGNEVIRTFTRAKLCYLAPAAGNISPWA